MAKAIKKKKSAKKEELVKLPLTDYLKLAPDDFENHSITCLFKLKQGLEFSTHTKGSEEQIALLIAKSMKEYENIRKNIFDAVKLYDELCELQDDFKFIDGLA
jgi:hypothetical protein